MSNSLKQNQPAIMPQKPELSFGNSQKQLLTVPASQPIIKQPQAQQPNVQTQDEYKLQQLLSKGAGNIKEFCQKEIGVFGKVTNLIIFLSILCILSIIVCIYVYINYGKIKNQESSTLLSGGLTPLFSTTVINANAISAQTTTNQFTYQFWLYVSTPPNSGGLNTLIFSRGDLPKPDFCVYLSNNRSILNAAAKVQSADDNSNDDIDSKLQFDQDTQHYTTVSTNHAQSQVPFQKWILVTVCGYTNQLKLYIDAIPFGIQNPSLKQITDKTGKLVNDSNYSPSLKPHSGNINIGLQPGNFELAEKSYISRLQVHSYPISQEDIKSFYKISPSTRGISV